MSGIGTEAGLEHKFDKRSVEFDKFKSDCYGSNKMLFPQNSQWDWKVQIFLFYNIPRLESVNFGLTNGEAVLRNKLNCGSIPSDVVFWNHGLHNGHLFNHPPYGELYYNNIVSGWLKARANATVPNVFVSGNNQCMEMFTSLGITEKYSNISLQLQVEQVEEANLYTHARMRKERLPYWDAAEVLRSPSRCHVTGDGCHVKMFVDIVRANILFNKLCDENNKWKDHVEEQFLY